MTVIDSSAIIKYLVKEDGWERIEDNIKEGCITLDLAIKEVANALIKKALKNEVDVETAKSILNRLPKIIRIVPQEKHIPKALEIAIRHKLTIYDSLFIAFSISTNEPLLTSDSNQAEISKKYNITTLLI